VAGSQLFFIKPTLLHKLDIRSRRSLLATRPTCVLFHWYGSMEKYILGKLLDDDLLPTLMGRLMAETSPVTANMASREHYLQYGVRIVDWTIYNYCLSLPLILPSTFGRRSSLRS